MSISRQLEFLIRLSWVQLINEPNIRQRIPASVRKPDVPSSKSHRERSEPASMNGLKLVDEPQRTRTKLRPVTLPLVGYTEVCDESADTGWE